MARQVTCPLSGTVYEQGCDQRQCPFHSKVERDHCAHTVDKIPLTLYGQHKGKRPAVVKEYLIEVEERLFHAMRLLRYADHCQDDPEVDDTVRAQWDNVRSRFPFNLPEFQWIRVERFNRMRREETFDQWLKHVGLRRRDLGCKNVKRWLKMYPKEE